ncbi:hypothetical protein C475_17713 [Halosimplex carlsbadense 2-9-1]|uniref:Uncharacterized protein n=1 Tax=Halosimplex carlsbadense 2-9-1 TaxID=797114 RepID=M0CIA5_9EURY|nr:hypothetical protein [Halosimplex carlsbadense]ELZ22373.1 hypothetical protein C475_17713 [Halosimplex carlsbadense 2-9-1]
MARFTIQLPAELAGDGADSGERTGADDRTGADGAARYDRRTDDGEVDAATHGFVSWVECWAGA